MNRVRQAVNQYFAGTEPWKLVAGSAGTVAAVFAIVRVLFRLRGARRSFRSAERACLARAGARTERRGKDEYARTEERKVRFERRDALTAAVGVGAVRGRVPKRGAAGAVP